MCHRLAIVEGGSKSQTIDDKRIRAGTAASTKEIVPIALEEAPGKSQVNSVRLCYD